MRKGLILVGGFILATGLVRADEVNLKNGDKLSGKVLGLAKGKLTLETPHSGIVQIDWSQIVSVKTDGKVKIKLSTGELLEGKLSPGAQGQLKVESDGAAQPVAIELGKVTGLNEPPVEWHGGIDLAYRATDGNTHTVGFFAAAEGLRESEVDKFHLKVISRYGKTSGIMTERNTYGLGEYAYKFTPEIFGYVSAEFLSDTFKDIELRSIFAIGAGYVFLKEKEIDFWADAGVAYINNDYRDTKDESHAGARLHAHLRVTVPWIGIDVVDDITEYPNFKDGSHWQLHNEASLATSVGKGWTLKVGAITDYDHKPVLPGLSQIDDVYFVGLGYHF
jgi:putative salt-induced outer membrane protein YdiY